MKLHKTQQKLLKLLEKHSDNPLTIRELQEELDISSPSVVQHHIQQLEKKGLLKRSASNPKDYQLLTSPEKQIVYLNLYGLAQCGPEGSILDGSPIDRIPIASRLLKFPAKEAFIVKAKGDSMEPKIKPGDLAIAQANHNPDSGDIVVCVNDGMAIIKKLIKQDKQVILQSLNNAYNPIIASDDFRVEGIVRNVLQYE
jgi:repressor LexA